MKEKDNRSDFPPNPAIYYRESGWQGWADLLGQQGADVTDPRNPVSVLRALLPVVAGKEDLWWEEKLIRDALNQAEPKTEG